jgi:hypothetical protein
MKGRLKMRGFIFSLLVILSLSVELYAKRYALVIGISDYQHPRTEDLKNQDSIRSAVKLFSDHNYSVETMTESEVTFENIVTKLQSYQTLKSKDTFIYYFIGHGGQFEFDATIRDEGDFMDEITAMYDYDPTITNFERYNKDHPDYLLDDDLDYLLQKIPAKQLVILDTCHSGTATKGGTGKLQVYEVPKRYSYNPKKHNLLSVKSKVKQKKVDVDDHRIVLSACKDHQVTYGNNQGGLFSHFLLKNIASHKQDNFIDIMKTTEEEIARYRQYYNEYKNKFDKPMNIVNPVWKLYGKDKLKLIKTFF